MSTLAPFVDVRWLRDAGRDVRLADVRWYLDGRSGRAAYLEGHLPGAVFVDVDADLAAPVASPGPSVRGRHPLPDAHDFALAMARAGIGDGATVIAYDDTGGMTAGRLVWMLRVLGRPAAVLSGGIDAWLAAGGPLDTGPVEVEPAEFTPRPWPAAVLADADEVAHLAGSGRGIVVDARAPERYRGDSEPIDARAGHVPGARNLPWADLVDPATKEVRPRAELRSRLAEAGIEAAAPVVCYCGSGVSACLDLLVFEHLGTAARLFPGSWSSWSADPARPIATGDAPPEIGPAGIGPAGIGRAGIGPGGR